jgi:site-specific DNA recombinase
MNKTNVILYVRVSTDEQAEKGYSLKFQQTSLEYYCEQMGYNVLKVYKEDHSAKDFNRPQWIELRKYVKANKMAVSTVLFTKWDRFSRNVEQALTVIREFDSMGVGLNASEQSLEMSNPDNKMVLSIYLTASQVEREKISSRTQSGMYQAKSEGYYAGKAPFGYDSIRNGIKAERGQFKGKRAMLVPNEHAHFVRKAFESVAQGFEPIEKVRHRLTREGMDVKKSAFHRMLRNVLYAGKIVVPEYKKEPSRVVDGVHKAIIDMKTYEKVQMAFRDSKKNKKRNETAVESDFPIRNFLTCGICGGHLTGSYSKGRTKKYGYYHCRGGCPTRIGIEKTHDSVSKVLNDIQINPNIKDLFGLVLKDKLEEDAEFSIKRKKEINLKLDEINRLLDNADDKYLIGELAKENYDRIQIRYSDEKMALRVELDSLEKLNEDISLYIEDGLKLLLNLGGLFVESENEGKQTLLGSLFSEKLLIGNEGCRTTSVNGVVEVLTRFGGSLEGYKKRKAPISDSFSVKVPGVGIEPTLQGTRV